MAGHFGADILPVETNIVIIRQGRGKANTAAKRYEESPLEQMAFEVQRAFEQGHAMANLVTAIEQQTDRVWQAAAPLVGM